MNPAGLKFGLYRLHWVDGGHSLASVGGLHDGTRWFAPVNWTNPSPQGIASTNWDSVLSAEPIDTSAIDAYIIVIAYPAGRHVFTRITDSDDWELSLVVPGHDPLNVIEYGPADVMRVMSGFLGTKEIAP